MYYSSCRTQAFSRVSKSPLFSFVVHFAGFLPRFPFSIFRLSAFRSTFPPFHLSIFLLSSFSLCFISFPFALYMSKAIDISPALSHNSLLFILAARKESERDGCLQRLPAYLPTSQSPQIVPFFPACLDLYPDALTSSSVGREIY